MEIMDGYKNTELGVIPDEWKVDTLGVIGEVKMCRRIFNSETKKIGTIPFYKIGTFGKDADAFISEELYRSYRKKFSYPNKGDVLISASGTLGRTIVYDGKPSYFQDSNIVWIVNNEKVVTNKFLYYVLQVVEYESEGSTIQRLYNSIINKTKFILPPLPEQKAIAEVLSDTDNLIQSLEKQIAKKRLIKQGAIQKLLSPKEGWEEKKLSELFTVTRGYVLSMKEIQATEDSEYKYPVFSSQTKNNGLMGYYKDYLYKDSITWTTDGANAGDVKFRKGRFYCTNVCGVLISNKGYANTCVAEAFNRVSKKYVSYVGNPKLMNNVVKDIELALPKEIDEQLYISQVIEDMEEEVLTLEKRLLKLKSLKKGLMQNLLTGKIRLKQDKRC